LIDAFLDNFVIACRNGNINQVQQIFNKWTKSGRNPKELIEYRNSESENALLCASLNAQPEVVEFLLQNGADVYVTLGQNMTPLWCVITKEDSTLKCFNYITIFVQNYATQRYLQSSYTIL
jgi:ankyrin repeat protein